MEIYWIRSEISARTDGGPRSRVCARETLHWAPTIINWYYRHYHYNEWRTLDKFGQTYFSKDICAKGGNFRKLAKSKQCLWCFCSKKTDIHSLRIFSTNILNPVFVRLKSLPAWRNKEDYKVYKTLNVWGPWLNFFVLLEFCLNHFHLKFKSFIWNLFKSYHPKISYRICLWNLLKK